MIHELMVSLWDITTILLKEDGTTKMIRRAETPEDYFRTLDGFWD